jgi:hypothetical protein
MLTSIFQWQTVDLFSEQMRTEIIVAAFLAQRPGDGGHGLVSN